MRRLLPSSLRNAAAALARRVADRLSAWPEPSSDDGRDVMACCIGYNVHGGYCVPLSSRHRPAARRILAGQVWEPDTLAFMSAHVDGGDVVHAGTYFGDFLPALAHAGDARHRVWAFEPNPENWRCAAITIALNGLRNVSLTQAGLGAEPGCLDMEVADASGRALGGRSHIVDTAAGGRVTPVEITTVDATVPADRHVSLLQLDVEGFEMQALVGAMGTIRRCRPTLVLENLPPRRWLEDHLLALGYREAGRLHRNRVLTSERTSTAP